MLGGGAGARREPLRVCRRTSSLRSLPARLLCLQNTTSGECPSPPHTASFPSIWLKTVLLKGGCGGAGEGGGGGRLRCPGVRLCRPDNEAAGDSLASAAEVNHLALSLSLTLSSLTRSPLSRPTHSLARRDGRAVCGPS